MKALLYKDFYQIRTHLAAVLGATLFFSMEIFQGWPFGAFCVVFAGCMVPLNLAFFDRRDRWDTLLPMLPYSARDVVLSRYCMGWLAAAGAGLALILGEALFGGKIALGFSSPFYESLTTALCMLAATLVLQAGFFLTVAGGGSDSAADAGIAPVLTAGVSAVILIPCLQDFAQPMAGLGFLAGAILLNLASVPLAVRRYEAALPYQERNLT